MLVIVFISYLASHFIAYQLGYRMGADEEAERKKKK